VLTQLGPGVHRLGDDIVNSYVLVDGADVTIVDAGVPRYWTELPVALASIGGASRMCAPCC
jgi:glyoxylase-like metal-dependent hydrolase (beta-lactamase superfamily II)